MDEPIHAPATLLTDAPADAGDRPRWIQIAYEGEFRGHPQGHFRLDGQVFAKVVENFRRHPAFQLGEGGLGCQPVVAFDYGHASEMSPTEGSIPAMGAPAWGWALDLDIRQGSKGAELWALTEFCELAKTYIRDRRLRWVSSAIRFQGVDHITGQPCGPLLTSVAFTNQPYLRGLLPIAATQRGITMTIEAEQAALFGALKVKTAAEAALRIPVLLQAETTAMTAEEECLKLRARVVELEKALADRDAATQEAEVANIMTTHGLDACMKDALLLSRRQEPEKFTALVAQLGQRRAPDARHAHLTAPLTAPTNAASPMAPSALATAQVGPDGRVMLGGPLVTTGAAPNTISLAGIAGPNRFARLLTVLRTRNPKTPEEEIAVMALELNRSGCVTD
jgi:phage I-like protein